MLAAVVRPYFASRFAPAAFSPGPRTGAARAVAAAFCARMPAPGFDIAGNPRRAEEKRRAASDHHSPRSERLRELAERNARHGCALRWFGSEQQWRLPLPDRAAPGMSDDAITGPLPDRPESEQLSRAYSRPAADIKRSGNLAGQAAYTRMRTFLPVEQLLPLEQHTPLASKQYALDGQQFGTSGSLPCGCMHMRPSVQQVPAKQVSPG